jgi:hypothetical protein
VELPFNLDGLFSLTYSFDTLKKVIEYLASQQADLKEQVRQLAGGNISAGGDSTNPTFYTN